MPRKKIIVHVRILVTLSIIMLLFAVGCEKNTESKLDERLSFENDEYVKKLSEFFSYVDTTDVIPRKIKDNLDTLTFIYTKRKFQPIFIKSFSENGFVDSLLDILNSAFQHGLPPERYHNRQIEYEYDESKNPLITADQRYNHLVNTELLAADAILKYASHMRHGIVNPRKLFTNSYYLPLKDSLNKKYFEPLYQHDVIKYLLNIQPNSFRYKNLQNALIKYSALQSIDWKNIPLLVNKIEPGERNNTVYKIAQRLTVLGFIDSLKSHRSDSTIYDSVLVSGIKTFQLINGLKDDGVIGKTTMDRLNITPAEYVEKIKLNLERFRWFDYSDTAKYILVNIPDFRLYAMESGVEKFNITVCTGRKNKWETPNLYGQISYFVLNPTWSVPRSIVEEEIVNGLRRDSSYLKKRNFKVYKSGVRVSLDGLTHKELLSSKSYLLVQDPGLGNALGKIKFMFRNPFGVYLHDTPSRAPFSYTNRAVSHGCVRVEKPLQLAEFFLNHNSKWNLDYLKIEIGQKVNDPSIVAAFQTKRAALRKNNSYGVTTEVKLDKKIPLFIDYYTVWVDENGRLNYRDDVYNRDKVLSEYLSIIK